MNDVMQARIASVLTIALGVWLLVSPLFIAVSGGAFISTLIVGSILTLAGVVQLVWENTLPSWVSGLTAVWMAISTVAFSMSGALFWNTMAMAIVAFLIAMWDGIEVDKVAEQHHTHA